MWKSYTFEPFEPPNLLGILTIFREHAQKTQKFRHVLSNVPKNIGKVDMTKQFRAESFGFIRADDLIKQEGEKQKKEDCLNCTCERCQKRKERRSKDESFNKILKSDNNKDNTYRED